MCTAEVVISLSMFWAESVKSASASRPGCPMHLWSHIIFFVWADVRRGSRLLFFVGMMSASFSDFRMLAVEE